MATGKEADLTGPGVSTYEEVEKILPNDYEPLLALMERMKAVCDQRAIEHLMMSPPLS